MNNHPNKENTDSTPAGFWRRLAAMCYDILCLLAVYLMLTVLIVFAREGQAVIPGSLWYQMLLLAITILFFVGFWLFGGQTLGMRAWRICLVDQSNQKITLAQAILRFMLATILLLPAGLGFWWILFSKKKLSLYDRFAKTKIVKY